ncbi:MAG TPA: hypothetical protein VES20_11840 [Bryobacteraceae bacterium]|nr:hypothetical protein [Bryobacteraceae bacterium]
MGFALWIDAYSRTAWAQGTHEYRPMGAAVVAISDRFRPRDFRQSRRCPPHLHEDAFAGFFGSLEEVNERLRRRAWKLRATPVHLR